MVTLTRIRALGAIDVRSVRRDPTLVWLALAPLAIALVLRWGVPWLAARLQQVEGLDLKVYDPLILSFFVLMMPNLVGAIIGFLLLDQRDDQTLTALQVTPLTLRGYLFYRALAPMGISALMLIVTTPLTELMTAGWGVLTIYAAISAPLAPWSALFVAMLAANKVQGFGVMKASGVLSWPAIIAWFLPMPWQLLMGIVPHYWIAKVVWTAKSRNDLQLWIATLIGFVYQAILVLVFMRQYERPFQRG